MELRVAFFRPQCVFLSVYAWVGCLGTYTDNLFVLEVFRGIQEPRTMWEMSLCFILTFSFGFFWAVSLSDGHWVALKTLPSTCKSLKCREDIIGLEWQLTVRAKMSVISSLYLDFYTSETRTSSNADTHRTRPLPRWSFWEASGLERMYKRHKSEVNVLATGEFIVRPVMLCCCLTLCSLPSAFFPQKWKGWVINSDLLR